MATEQELAVIREQARAIVDAGLADGTIPPLPQEAIELATRLGCPWPRRSMERSA
jgi:hypothetical protein